MNNLMFNVSIPENCTKNNNLETDKEYDKITKIIVLKTVYEKSLRYRILSNEDLFSELKYQVMLADWLYTPDKKSSKNTYRINRVKWRLSKICDKFQKHYKIGDIKVVELQNNDFVVEKEAIDIDNIINGAKLNKKELSYIEMLKEGNTIQDIANDNNVSDKYIYQKMKNIRKKIKQTYV